MKITITINPIKAICTVLALWIVFSFAEINVKNVHPNPSYSRYNIITSFVNGIGGGQK